MKKYKTYYYEYNEFEEEIETLYDTDYGTYNYTKRRQEVSCYDYFCGDFDTMDDWV